MITGSALTEFVYMVGIFMVASGLPVGPKCVQDLWSSSPAVRI